MTLKSFICDGLIFIVASKCSMYFPAGLPLVNGHFFFLLRYLLVSFWLNCGQGGKGQCCATQLV